MSKDHVMLSHDDDDAEQFLDLYSSEDRNVTKHAWCMLLVDDDESIHQRVRDEIENFRFEGCKIEVLHAYNAIEAKELLLNNAHIAVIFHDYVSDRAQASFNFVDFVRNDLGNSEIRIILRGTRYSTFTDWDLISRYDISDYRSKNDLVADKFYTTLTATLRSYKRLHEINTNRLGLEKITKHTASLMKVRSPQEFWQQLRAFMCESFPVTDDFLMLTLDGKSNKNLRVVDSGGKYRQLPTECRLHNLHEDVVDCARSALSMRTKQIRSSTLTLYLETSNATQLIIFHGLKRKLRETETRLIDVFVSNAAIAFDNIELFQNVQSLAYEDQLTKLGNRSAFVDAIRFLLREIHPGDEYTIIDVDLDHFDDINDLIGQRHGDKVLQAFAEHIENVTRSATRLCRISGDEFGLIYKTKGIGAVNFDPYNLLKSLEYKLDVNAYDITVRPSLGITKFSDRGQTAESIMRNAWIALRHSKDNGRNAFTYYSSNMDNEVVKRAELISDLRRALVAEEFTLFYQPQYSLKSEQACGVEALLRWQAPDGSFRSPAEFIPAMERSGLIVDVGSWVLRQACIDAKSWEGTNFGHIAVSVNISVAQLYHRDFVKTVATVLEETQLNPKRLKLEITESLIMQDAAEAMQVLHELRGLGLDLAIDDFGQGYSSLSYLQQLPFDYIKVDQSFVRNMVENSGDAVIADVIITLGHSFGMKVIAEGVEDLEQLKFLRVLGCDQIQGYYYAKPMAEFDLRQFAIDKRI
ncbi:EAL domain-containing protein [Curvivirga aplysinae]|uniref:EAL domain-containing protein n=1 Tax=Curvivirga aplysinae TaxID=2529852 RepID=UPI0012BC113F|nr:EAL domain-containing protein [Curvivirga aplysinae]MTI09031.1 EAL domain-containing protein [Curvivirga aplysinae]